MAYEFRPDERVDEAFARTAKEQLDRALSALGDELEEDPVEAVHAARKAIKKERSLLRLGRPGLAAGVCRRENATLRAAGRSLSGMRDDVVLTETLDELSERYAGQLPAPAFAAVRKRLRVRAGAGNGTPPVTDALDLLQGVRARVGDWQLAEDDWDAVEGGLVRSYKRGRRAFSRARTRPTAPRLHEWRKRVKDLWYHERVLAAVGGPGVRGQAKDAHGLADLLGDDHDLAVLRGVLEDERSEVPADVDAVLALIDHRREQLQREAFALGRRVYAEKPSAFRRRMKRSWEAGRRELTEHEQRDPSELARATRVPVPA